MIMGAPRPRPRPVKGRLSTRRLLLLLAPATTSGALLALRTVLDARGVDYPHQPVSLAIQAGLLGPTIHLQVLSTRRAWNAPWATGALVCLAATGVGLALSILGAYTGAAAALTVWIALAYPNVLQDLANAVVVTEAAVTLRHSAGARARVFSTAAGTHRLSGDLTF